MPKNIYFSVVGSPGGGGPSVFVHKTSKELAKRGYSVQYSDPSKADVCLCIIESGKTLKRIDRNKTKVFVRLDNAYFKGYWNGSPGREWRPDMTALHEAIKRDVKEVDHMIYQSEFSKRMIDSEIAKRDNDFSIINNGVDVSLFKPIKRQDDGFINLFSIGKMRNGYIMDGLVGVYKELKKRGVKTRLILAGSMDAECSNIFNKHKADPDIKHLGSFSNDSAINAFLQGDIFIANRIGSSNDNVVVEALASGLPCIVPSFGGNSELINNEKEGIIVNNGDGWNYGQEYNEKIADAAQIIIKDLQGYKQRARQHALSELTLNKMVEKYISVMKI